MNTVNDNALITIREERKSIIMCCRMFMRHLLFILVVSTLCSPAFSMPSYPEAKAAYQSSDAVLLDRHGAVIHELRVDPKARKLEWTRLVDVSPALVKAVIRSEDKRFYQHHGVDWTALASAAAGGVFSSKARGASTITMQLAALIDGKKTPAKGRRTMGRKWEQIKAAQAIEKSWTKEQILEAYLNLVSFRGELQGIAAASRGLFDKAPGGLDAAESSILAALIRSPNADSGKVGERAAMLAASMNSECNTDAIKTLANDCLSRPYHVRRQIDLAPHVALRLLHNGSSSAVSTLDARIQRVSIEALRQAVGSLSTQNAGDGAVLVVENRTGDVLAYVGNSGSVSTARFVDGIQARRQAGSTLKPFLYGLAIENKIITAASLNEDAPLDLPTERGIYHPENYDKEFRGFVPVRTALASSLNIPAVKTLGLVGTGSFVRKLQAFGFTGLREPEQYGLSLALGSADVRLWDMVNAYRALANKGVWSRLRLSSIEETGVRRRALSREAAFIISSILSDREARSETFSLESALGTRFWTAVKTGTSKDMRDNWCVGYSDRYTVGVWVGNFSGSPMWNVSGISGAAPAWLDIMNYLHHDAPSRAPSAPPQVIQHQVLFVNNGKPAGKREWFISGTEQDTVVAGKADPTPRIIYPTADMIIAMDPDIPDDLQKVYFEASSGDPSLTMVLDGSINGKAPATAWRPVPGVHELQLVKNHDVVMDRITFEVR